jgi:KUP system potassium uptake protein
VLLLVGLFGTAIFYGDGVITPGHHGAVGRRGPGSGRAAACTLGDPDHAGGADRLFAVQRFGTGGIGKFFGPITLVWFGCWWRWACRTSWPTRRCWWR